MADNKKPKPGAKTDEVKKPKTAPKPKTTGDIKKSNDAKKTQDPKKAPGSGGSMGSLRTKQIPNVLDKKKNFLDTKNQKFAARTSAVRWFSKAVAGIQSNNRKMPEGLYSISGREHPFYGEMVLFGYDAKHKDTLPYWDAFPLIIVTAIRANGFSGLNLHYMPPQARKEIIKYLIHYRNKAKSAILYAHKVVPVLQQLSQSDINFCYKNYLASHVRTKFVTVGKEYWELACELPLQEFRKASAREVWADRTRKKK